MPSIMGDRKEGNHIPKVSPFRHKSIIFKGHKKHVHDMLSCIIFIFVINTITGQNAAKSDNEGGGIVTSKVCAGKSVVCWGCPGFQLLGSLIRHAVHFYNSHSRTNSHDILR